MATQTQSSTPKKHSVSIEEGFVIARQFHARGNETKAREIYRQILKKSPDHAESMHYLGLIEYSHGHTTEALNLLRRAVQLSPKTTVFHSNLGVLFKKEGMLYEAEAAHMRALSLDPEQAKHHYDLGLVQQLQERYEEAEESYRQAIALKPNYSDALNNLGSVLKEQDEMEAAAEAFRSAIVLAPEDPVLYYNLGCVLIGRQYLDEAEAAYRQSLVLRPDYASAHKSLGKVLFNKDRMVEAASALRKAIKLQSDDYEAYYYLADVHPFTTDDPLFGTLNDFLNRAGLSDTERFMVYGALAKAYDHLDMPAEAFEHYRQSNEEVWRNADFNLEQQKEFHQETKRTFPVAPKLHAPSQEADWTPIFVIGMSCSGKTLTEKLLACHEDVYAGEENMFWSTALKHVLKRYGILKDYPDCVPLLNEKQKLEIGEEYRKLIDKQAKGKPFVVNTIPGNHQFVGLIFQSLPTARVIDCHRDPLDNCLKVYFKRYRTGNEYSYNLQALGLYYRLYYDLLVHWKRLFPERMLSVRYEEMLQAPLGMAERIYRHCSIPFDPGKIDTSMLNSEEIGCSIPYSASLGPLKENLEQALDF